MYIHVYQGVYVPDNNLKKHLYKGKDLVQHVQRHEQEGGTKHTDLLL